MSAFNTPRILRACGSAPAARGAMLRPTTLHVSLALLGVTMMTALPQNAQAFTPDPAFAPVVTLPFTGAAGAAPGALPPAPPVYIAQDQRLYGMTQRGGFTYSDALSNVFMGAVLYSLDPSSSADSYQALRAQGDLGFRQQVMPYWHEGTQTLYSGSGYAANPNPPSFFQPNMGVLHGLKANGGAAPTSIILAQPDSALLAPSDYGPTGQMAVSQDGYAYFSPSLTRDQCFEAAVTSYDWNATLPHHASNYGKYNMTYRIKLGEPGAQPEVFANWCDFASAYVYRQEGSRPTTQRAKREYHPYGSKPSHLLLGDDGKYLYAISEMASSSALYLGAHNLPVIMAGETIPGDYPTPDYGGIPDNDKKGIPVAALIRIDMQALNGVPLSKAHADKVEVLHWFAESRDGGLLDAAPSERVDGVHSTQQFHSLVEVGDWIYGTNKTVWRIYKGNDASVTQRFQIVHGFDAVGTRVADDGSQPGGPLALAADGNLYGTTYKDTRSTSLGASSNTGTIYRLVIDASNPNALPRYEPLQYLDLNTVGANPNGLSAGEFTATTQRLYGTTQFSANPADANTPLAQGAIFHINVPLPTVYTQPLRASSLQARVGDTVALSWQTDSASRCVASGSNGGLWQGDKPLASTGSNVTLTEAGTVTFGLRCVRSHGGPDAESETVTITVSAASTDTGGGSGNGNDGAANSGSGGGGGAFGDLALLAAGLLWLRRKTMRV